VSDKVLTKGLEQLRDLRDEILRQRAQMRQSYMVGLNANLSATYAGLVRLRDAVGTASTRTP
jgi:conjugative transfer pilus assembly protein TraH